MSEELWKDSEYWTGDSEQGTVKKKKCKKAKWLSDEASQIAEERKEVKSRGERERYSQLNTDFQGLARKDKKAFLK